MIEKLILDYLSDALSAPCYASVPEAPSGIFCVVEKTGSGEADGLFSATVAVQSYGPRKESGLWDAAQLNEEVKAVMSDLIRLPEVSACRMNTDYRFPDTARRLPRYQAVFDITHY